MSTTAPIAPAAISSGVGISSAPLVIPRLLPIDTYELSSIPGAVADVVPRTCRRPDAFIAEIAPRVESLRKLSTQWYSRDTFHGTLSRLAKEAGSKKRLEARLAAEEQFYRDLYGKRRQDKFEIFPVPSLRFRCDDRCFPSIVFVSGGYVYGCANFRSDPGRFVVKYVQGLSHEPFEDQRKRFGGFSWIEIFMDRAIRSYYGGLHDLGVTMMLMIDDDWKNFVLTRIVRDRYFTHNPSEYGIFHPLNPDRRRVREILQELGIGT